MNDPGDENTNGAGKMLPTIQLGWDAKDNVVHVAFLPEQFKSYEFILMVLEGAKIQIGNIQREAHVLRLQQQQAQQIEAARLANQIRRR